MASVEEAGQRDVAPTTLNVTQTYNGEGAFTVTATLTYLGEGFNPDFTDSTGPTSRHTRWRHTRLRNSVVHD